MTYKNQPQTLVEDFTDIGYMAENVEVTDINDQIFEIKRSNQERSMTLLISSPDEEFIPELQQIDKFMSEIQVPIECFFLFASASEKLKAFAKELKIFKVAFDVDDEFGNMYGTKIAQGSLEGKLTKALFLISKDGAIFYLEMPEVIEDTLNLERLKIELNRAYVTYTGVGCHG